MSNNLVLDNAAEDKSPVLGGAYFNPKDEWVFLAILFFLMTFN